MSLPDTSKLHPIRFPIVLPHTALESQLFLVGLGAQNDKYRAVKSVLQHAVTYKSEIWWFGSTIADMLTPKYQFFAHCMFNI